MHKFGLFTLICKFRGYTKMGRIVGDFRVTWSFIVIGVYMCAKEDSNCDLIQVMGTKSSLCIIWVWSPITTNGMGQRVTSLTKSNVIPQL